MADTDTASSWRASARPHILGRRVVTMALATLGLSAALAAPAASAHACRGARTPIWAAPRAEMQASVVCLINAQRIHRGLPRLHENKRLNRSAQGWTNVMVRDRAFSHGADFAARISAVGFSWSNAGENIAAGYATPASVVAAWMASPGHCRNILAPNFLDVGTGVSRHGVPGAGGPGTWTQDFALPMGHGAPSGNWGPAGGCPY